MIEIPEAVTLRNKLECSKDNHQRDCRASPHKFAFFFDISQIPGSAFHKKF